MRARKKAADKIIFIIPDKYSEFNTVHTECNALLEYVEEINSASDAIQQIAILKEAQRALFLTDNEDLRTIKANVQILCFMFYQAPLKSSHKRTLCRILQDLCDKHPDVVKSSLQYSLEIFMNTSFGYFLQKIKICTDCLLGLLDNFSVGSLVMQEQCHIVYKYIGDALNYVDKELKKQSSPELYEACQSVLKLFILIIQSCENIQVSLKERMNDDISGSLQNISEAIGYLLAADDTNLNCRLNAGIALCYYHFSLGPASFKVDLFKERECSFFRLKMLPHSSQLSILSGIMAVLPSHEFVEIIEDNVVADTILHKIFHVSECVEDSDILLLCTRDMIQWSNLIRNVFCNESKELVDQTRLRDLKKLFREDGKVMDMLFNYVLHYREHYVDTLRHLSKDLFRNILNLHILSIDTDPGQSALLKTMANFLLVDLPQHSQGKYGLLSCIVEIVGTNTILQWHPPLPDKLYMALREVNLISHVSDLLESLFRKSLLDDKGNKIFTDMWLRPLLMHIGNSQSKERSAAFNEHVLPKLFRVKPNSLFFLLSELSSLWEESRGNCFSSLITCIKFHQRQRHGQTVLDFLSTESLLKALCHADDQVRLSAFALICENPKTTEPIPLEVFDLIKGSLPYNVNCQSPAFRQQLVSYIKKLLNRMAESKYSVERKLQLSNGDAPSSYSTIPATYEDFLCWLKTFLYSCLYPGANFPRRVTSLNMLFLVHSIFSQSFCTVASRTEAETLLYALLDTYENNKIISLKILSSSDTSLLEDENDNYLETLLQAALILASSTKPPDAVTSAYLFAFMAKSKNFEVLLSKYALQQNEKGLSFLELKKELLDDLACKPAFNAVMLLTGELLKHMKVAQKSLLEAAAHKPLYGVLACIRSVISLVDFGAVKDKISLHHWSSLMSEMVSLCIKVASIVEPVVCNSSPEGHLPMDTDSDNISQLQAAVRRAIGKRFQSAIVEVEESSHEPVEVVLDMVKTHAVTAQILLLCCWRTHKEVSLLFGDIADKIPVEITTGKSPQSGILKVSQVLDIGKYFIRQMTLVKHKGAFEQAYIGFTKLCYMLWRSTIEELQELPKVWLSDMFLAIRGLKDDVQLCSTRRSAGLPFIIQALLTSEPGLSNSTFFKETVSSLLSMVSFESEEKNTDEKIHALNILRVLFRDSCLSDLMIPFVSEGLKVSILGFKSQLWAVRNSSTLLFSALMTRIFGVAQSQDESGKKNRLTGRTFFSYYRDTYSFLFEELQHCAAIVKQHENRTSLVPALYPILLVLGKLYPAPGENDQRLGSFIPFLYICAGSPVWKIRVLAGKALVPLVSAENIIHTLQFLFDSLPSDGSPLQSQNEIHGRCLQILYVLQEYSLLPEDVQKSIEHELPTWIQSHTDLVLNNRCYATRAVFLEILLIAMTTNFSLDLSMAKGLIIQLLPEVKSPLAAPDKEHYLCSAVIVSLLFLLHLNDGKMHNFLLEINEKFKSLSHFIEELLLSPYESVRCTVLQLLQCLLKNKESNHGFDKDSALSPVFFSSVFSSVGAVSEKKVLDVGRYSKDPGLYLFLLDMQETESADSSCLGMVYKLLGCLPHVYIQSKDTFDNGPEISCRSYKLDYFLSQLETCKREDIFNSMLYFASLVAFNMCRDATMIAQHGGLHDASKCKECVNVLKKWSVLMEESSCPENCIYRRKTVISSFQILFCDMQLYKSRDNFTVHLWQALLYLLMDDEPEIKEMAVQIIQKMKGLEEPDCFNPKALPVVPPLAVDVMMELFVSRNICSSSDCFGVLLNWVVSFGNSSVNDMGDEQPFDRGELNVFAEDLLLTSIASKHLSKYLHSSGAHQNSIVSIDRISPWKNLAGTKESFTIEDIIELCLSDCNTIIQKILTRGVVSPLLDSQFDCSLLQLCQKFHVILCLLPWTACSMLKLGVKELLDKVVGIKCRIFYLKELLSKLSALI